MLSSGGTKRSLKMEAASCSTTGPGLGLDGPSLSIPDSSFDPLRDDRSLNRLDFLSELSMPGEAGVSTKESLLSCYICDFSCHHIPLCASYTAYHLGIFTNDNYINI